MNEFTQQFLVECRELADQASADLLVLEERPSDVETLEKVFRAFHTLKGSAGIMDYTAMEQLLHRAEDVLQEVRAGRRTITPALVDGLMACIGQLARWFGVIERTDEMPADAVRDTERLAAAFGAPARAAPVAAALPWEEDFLAWARQQSTDAGKARTVLRWRPSQDAFFKGEDPVARIGELDGLISLRLTPAEPWPQPSDLQPFDCNLVIEALFSSSRSALEQALKALSGRVEFADVPPALPADPFPPEARAILEEQLRFLRLDTDPLASAGRFAAALQACVNVLTVIGADASPLHQVPSNNYGALIAAIEGILAGPDARQSEAPAPSGEAAITTIRVEAGKLDDIVNLTGELLVVKNALGHWARMAASNTDPQTLAAGLKTQQDLLERHLNDLQRLVFDLRVLPLDRVFSRFPRLVRETAATLGKQVTFSTEGADTKADKAIVEALFEPLLHIIRNAIDHGVETPEARTAAGKPSSASITLRASRESDSVIVEVADDGRGIDVAAVRRIATARGVAEPSAIADMSDEQAAGLIFAPGFSTAEAVTDLSGRGVGMGAVRSAIERVGGEVGLVNRPGQGLTVRLVLPFTITLTRVMTVEAGGQTFGVPFDAIVETVRIPRANIRPLGAGRAFVLRNETIPLINLASSLGLPETSAPREACVVIAWAGGLRAGLEIDRPGERMDLMLKPVEGILSGMRAIAGTSLLGDGQVLIVLDLKELME